MKLNNNPPPDVTTVQITDERLTFGLEDGRTVSVPLSFYPTLQLATRRERADFEISHTSVYWPKLDCDISSDCLLRGAKEARRFAERAWRKKGKLAAASIPQKLFTISGADTPGRFAGARAPAARATSGKTSATLP